MAWGFRRYTYGTGKTSVRYGNCISFLRFPPRSQGSVGAKEEELWIVMAVCLTRYLFQSWDFLQVAPVLENLDLWIEALENGLLRHQANAVREVLDFDAILSGPTVLPTQRVALQQRSVAKVCLQTKNRLARIPSNLNFGWKNIRNIDWKHWEFTDSPDSRWEKGWNLYEWIRMNMKLQPMTLSRPRAWRGLQVGKAPGYRKSQDFECCFQLQTLSALQVTLNLWLWHIMTKYPFVQWNSNKTTFIPMPGCVTNVTWSVTPACSSGCPSSSTSS